MVNILVVGDVVSKSGCDFLKNRLPQLKRDLNVDFTIVNGENSANGNGITKDSAADIFTAGADVITTGNHVFQKMQSLSLLDENEMIVRPANYPDGTPGRGYITIDMFKYKVLIINLLGLVYLNSIDCPFKTADEILKNEKADIIIIDFHAEATSEKRALAEYLAGRVTAVVGTHTHVQTNDASILGGTAFITDVGMTGVCDSILGIAKEPVIKKFLTKMPVSFESTSGKCFLNSVLIQCDEKTNLANSIKQINIFE